MTSFSKTIIPPRAGLGLRHPHYQHIIKEKPPIDWFEVHSENFFAEGGQALRFLERVRCDYPLSMHGVGLSLGSAGDLDQKHLESLKRIVDRFKPALVSEHVSWSVSDGKVMNDLLPLPYTQEALDILVEHIQQTQDFLGRQILIENPSTYLCFTQSEMEEYDFMAQAAKRSGCAILLDVNNMYVGKCNHGIDMDAYFAAIPKETVKEIHLAGHLVETIEGQEIVIDTHGSTICEDVWALYQQALTHYGAVPTLIERDTNIPALSVLMEEINRANEMLNHD